MDIIDKITGSDKVDDIVFSEVGFAIMKERLHQSIQRANMAIIIIAVSAVTFLGVSQWAVSHAQEAARDAEKAAKSASSETIRDVDEKVSAILESRAKSTSGFKDLHKKAEERDEEIKAQMKEDTEDLREDMKDIKKTNALILEHLLKQK